MREEVTVKPLRDGVQIRVSAPGDGVRYISIRTLDGVRELRDALDAFLASRESQSCLHDIHAGECAECDGGSSTEMVTLGCEHGRAVGQPCPHCIGINAAPEPERDSDWEDRQSLALMCGDDLSGCEHIETGRSRPARSTKVRPTPAAPEPERFWLVVNDFGGWFYCQCYDDGSHVIGSTICIRPTEADARADGIASGLPEWKGGGK